MEAEPSVVYVPLICEYTGKYKYLTRKHATKDRKRMRDRMKHVEPMHLYLCDRCGGWHFGSDVSIMVKSKYRRSQNLDFGLDGRVEVGRMR